MRGAETASARHPGVKYMTPALSFPSTTLYACMPRRVEQEFVQFCVANPVMLKPVLDMQYSLRRATFGMCRAQVPPFHTRAMQRISALACLGLAPTSGVRYWTAVMHKRYGKTTERDPMRRAIESAMAMTAKQRDAAVGEVSLAVRVSHAAPCTPPGMWSMLAPVSLWVTLSLPLFSAAVLGHGPCGSPVSVNASRHAESLAAW